MGTTKMSQKESKREEKKKDKEAWSGVTSRGFAELSHGKNS